MQADLLLQQGDLDGTLDSLQQSVREQPSDPALACSCFNFFASTVIGNAP